MIASETDLYACGHKVYVPSPRSRPQSRREYQKSLNTPQSSEQTKDLPQKALKQLSPLNSHVKELGESLEFSDNVVTEVSPHLLSYSKSKGAVKSLFRPDSLGIQTHAQPKNTPIGRHNCRGEIKRHFPCHLVSSHAKYSPDFTPYSDHKAPVPRQYADRFDSQTAYGKTSTGLYMAPSTKSVIWEDEILGKVSSYTARRLTGKPSNISIEASTQPLAQQRSSIIRNASSSLFSELSVSEPEQLMSPPPRDYITEYQDGARPVHQKMADRSTVVMDSGAKFDAVVQDSFPYSPSQWCAGSKDEKSMKKVDNVKGYRKWLGFPQPTQTTEDLQWQSTDASALNEKDSELSMREFSFSHSTTQNFKNKDFFKIIREWCSKWQIHLQSKDIPNSDTILTDLQNLCDTTRMIAVASIALLAERQALMETRSSHSLKNSFMGLTHSNEVEEVSEQMVDALQQRLKDTAEHVRVPSAITLYCIDKQNKEAEDVLLSSVSAGSHIEGWASVQCLSRAGVATLAIVEELLSRLNDQSQATTSKASQLLASLSSITGLVHSLLSERLNCSGWLERLAACHLLPKLHGGINKDVCQKLVHLAWNDWSPEVRTGAAQALGLTGHGKMIHDEIGRRLTDESETVRLDALKKLQSLNLMTTQLLSSYLSCFLDTHTSIRIQAVKMAGPLKLSHPKVQQALLSLLTHDPSWKVKVTTLQAMAECGVQNEALVSQLVWVIRFEKLGNVRAEGCRTIAKLCLKEEKVIQTLRDLLTVEDDPTVKNEVIVTLDQLGCSLGTEDNMLEMIRSEVQRLGTQETITAEVVGSDRTNTTHRVIQGTAMPATTTRDIFNLAGARGQKSLAIHTMSTTEEQTPNTTDTPSNQIKDCSGPDNQLLSGSHHSSNTDTHKTLNSSLEESSSQERCDNDNPKTVATCTDSNAGVEGTHCDEQHSKDSKKTRPSRHQQRTAPETGKKGRRDKVWSPDRETIDGHFEKIRKRSAVAGNV